MSPTNRRLIHERITRRTYVEHDDDVNDQALIIDDEDDDEPDDDDADENA